MKEDKDIIEVKMGNVVYREVISKEFELSDLTPDQAKAALLRAIGKTVFYLGVRTDAKRQLAKLEADFEQWYNDKYQLVSMKDDKKSTEKAKAAQITTEYSKEWESYKRKIRIASARVDYLYALVKGFDDLARALHSVLASIRTEMNMCVMEHTGARGAGNFLEA